MIDTCYLGNPDCWNTGLCDAVDILRRTRCSSCERIFESFSCFFRILSNYLEVIAFYFFYKKDFAIIVPSFYSGYIEVYLLGRTPIGILCFLVFLVYKFRRRHIWMDTTVEVFLRRRKNIDACTEHSSQLDFPLWVYDQLNNGEDMIMEDIADNDKEIAKKMMIVALWCIQLKPAERPSMSKVIEMLEGNINDLHMPAKPLLSSPYMLDQDQYLCMEPADSSTTHQLGSISQEVTESNISVVLEDCLSCNRRTI
ncbi:hypothetical protein MRB53_016276 [Persea americana]|uniref:Uncharacterized protein n=1 Tax=Persea americana TaxID=3435 RepID=A0ACC2M1F3_PERAE|nr:hypothetical protein MRB53_016276 [Persea americana]